MKRYSTATPFLASLWGLILLSVVPQASFAARATTDRLDDSLERQVHIMYVVPKDGIDRALDTNGTIDTSVRAFERWFESKSDGRRLRVDRYQGELDITFYRLPRTDAQYASFGDFVRDEIERDLIRAGFNRANKMYAVYYDGRSNRGCGGAFWPPALPGKVVALYLKGLPPNGMPCASNPFAVSEFSPGYWEFGMLHAIVAGLGAVPTCAPHHTMAGHVSDDPRDLMYSGYLPWNPSFLDVNNDDYFSHENPACLDLEDSLYLLPPGSYSGRSSVDRPDDLTGKQIHVMYVVPSDGVDRALDTNGTIETSVAAFEHWFETQSGGRKLRFDRYQGELDITFYRLPRTDAQIASYGDFVRDQVERDLINAGFNSANKMYAVYYDGRSTRGCGGAFWPPSLPGKVVALYLKGEPPNAPPCALNPFATSPLSPGYVEFAMLHEIMHGLGVVATCAPRHTQAGHVSEDPRDLMYAGPLAWNPSILDINNDDYFSHENPSCLDLEDSLYLLPPGS